MKTYSPLLVLVGLALLFALRPSACQAQIPPALNDYLSALQTLQADFVQTVFAEDEQIIQESAGRMFMRRPGRFRWQYDTPYEQLIVADGERFWLYDKDLEQITVRRVDQALSNTPLAVLSGAAAIEELFQVSNSYTVNDQQWYELTPMQESPEFNLLRLAFNNQQDPQMRQLSVVELVDNFQRRTRLSLTNVQLNTDLDPFLFRFIPPTGVDVVGDIE